MTMDRSFDDRALHSDINVNKYRRKFRCRNSYPLNSQITLVTRIMQHCNSVARYFLGRIAAANESKVNGVSATARAVSLLE